MKNNKLIPKCPECGKKMTPRKKLAYYICTNTKCPIIEIHVPEIETPTRYTITNIKRDSSCHTKTQH